MNERVETAIKSSMKSLSAAESQGKLNMGDVAITTLLTAILKEIADLRNEIAKDN